MSCESKPNQIAQTVAQFAGGISRLASKRSFYAGVAVGAAGTGGVMLLVNRFRRPREEVVGQASLRSVTAINYGGTGIPVPLPAGRTKPELKKLPISPAGTLTPADRARSNPQKISMVGVQPAGSALPRLMPILGAPLPETKLQPAEIKIQANGEVFTPKTSYRVLTSDGRDTGLAITPEVIETEDEGKLAERENSWCVTHTRTGQLISGPYDTINKAQKLATQLAPLSWGGANMTQGEIGRAQQIIEEYQHLLEGGQG